MKVLVDANLPIRLARWLEGQGHDARHVAELPDGYETVDRLVWEVADAEERVVISKDVDFRDRQILTGSPKRLLRSSLSSGSVRKLAVPLALRPPAASSAPVESVADELLHGDSGRHAYTGCWR